MAFKMKGSPMQRNYGIGSPNKKTDTETKYLDDKTNSPKTPKMNKEVTQKRPPRPPREIRSIPVTDRDINPLPNEEGWWDPQLQAPGPGIGTTETKADKRKKVRAAKKAAKAQAKQNN